MIRGGQGRSPKDISDSALALAFYGIGALLVLLISYCEAQS